MIHPPSSPHELPNIVRFRLTFACAFSLATPVAAEEDKPKNKTLIDFTHQDTDRAGAEVTVRKRYGWASGSWDKNLVLLEGQGLLVNHVSGKGNMGGDKSANLAEFESAFLIIVIGNRNAASSLGVRLIDADGTEAVWNFPLAAKPVGTALVCRMPLATPDKEDKPGKVPGLDKKKIRKWQIAGDWQEAKMEVLLVKLGAMP